MNTKNSFKGLEEAMRTMGQQSMLQSVIKGMPESVQRSAASEPQRDSSVPAEIFEDEYFLKNLPSSYGSLSSAEPPSKDDEYNPEQSMFGSEVRKCSMGFQEMSRNLSALGGKGSAAYPYYSQPSAESTASSVVDPNRPPDYSSLSESNLFNGQSIVREKKELREEEEFSLTPKIDYNKVAESLNVLKKDKEDRNTPPAMLDYTRLSQNLSVFNTAPKESSDNRLSATEKMLRYERLGKNFSAAFQVAPNHNNNSISITNSGSSSLSMEEKEQEVNRYQNVTSAAAGYSGASVDVRPYAIAKFNFVAEFESELGFGAGEMVYLTRYVDNEWVEGEIDGHRGMFPISYVNVIVDCSSEASRSTAVTVHENLQPDTYHRVLYNFSSQMEGDITVAEEEVVLIVERKIDGDWVLVENSQGDRGVMPGNHLDTKAEFDGKEQFDIERLLKYGNEKKTDTEHKEDTGGVLPSNTAPKPELKFFDPLCSPSGDGEEMIRIEQELERRAKEPRMIRRLQQPPTTPQYPYKRIPPPPPNAAKQRTPKLVPKPHRDIETLISNNLSKLKTLQASDSSSPNSSRKVPMSQMVLEEMRGKNPEPMRPASGAKYELDLSNQVDDLIRGVGKTREEEMASPKPGKRAAPPVPPAPRRSTKSPAPPRPANPPKTKTVMDLEPIYSQINKEARKYERSFSVTGEEKKPAPPRPCRPPLLPAMSLPVSANPPAPSHVKTIEVQVDVHSQEGQGHSYDTPERDESAATPTNEVMSSSKAGCHDDLHLNQMSASEEDELSNRSDPIYGYLNSSKNSDSSVRAHAPDSVYGSYPAIPERTSSILRREQELYQEQIQQQIHQDRFGPPAFPPDRKSPMSPPPAGQDGQPPKVASLPSCRSSSVASSIKSRSVFYASV